MNQILMSVLFFMFSALAQNSEKTELQIIDALLETVRVSGVVFIRNGKEYTSQEAYDHMREKLKNAQNSWMAPPREKWTAVMFIDKVASKSSLSGKPYLVRFSDGRTIESREWLLAQLREMESKHYFALDLFSETMSCGASQ